MIKCTVLPPWNIKKWKKAVDNGKVFEALLIDIRNAFDRLSRELITAKADAYRFSFNTLKLIDRKQTI